MSNVLPDAAIVGGVLGGLQFLKAVVPQMDRWPPNCVRALGFGLAYGMVVINAMVAHPVSWQDLWGLLPLAGALSGTATLAYHAVTDNTPAK